VKFFLAYGGIEDNGPGRERAQRAMEEMIDIRLIVTQQLP